MPWGIKCFPHARGGAPEFSDAINAREGFPPRARGSTMISNLSEIIFHVSPTRAREHPIM